MATKSRYLHTVTVGEEDEKYIEQLKSKGIGFTDIFKKGLEIFRKSEK